jgi:hypothetical protein
VLGGAGGSTLGVTLFLVAVCGASDGVAQGALFGEAALLPARYTQALISGTAMSGVAVSLTRVITKAAMPDTPAGLRASALLYFVLAACTCAACAVLYALVLPRLPAIRAWKRAALEKALTGRGVERGDRGMGGVEGEEEEEEEDGEREVLFARGQLTSDGGGEEGGRGGGGTPGSGASPVPHGSMQGVLHGKRSIELAAGGVSVPPEQSWGGAGGEGAAVHAARSEDGSAAAAAWKEEGDDVEALLLHPSGRRTAKGEGDGIAAAAVGAGVPAQQQQQQQQQHSPVEVFLSIKEYAIANMLIYV